MKKQIVILSAALAISSGLFAQGGNIKSQPDLEQALKTKPAKDTVYVPLIEKDTLIAVTLTYKGIFGSIKGKSGFVKLKGYTKAGSDQFVSQPQFAGYLNHRKKAFKKKVLQAF